MYKGAVNVGGLGMAIWAWGAKRAAVWGAKKGWEKWKDRKHQEVNMEVEVRTENTHKYMPFRAQRALAAFIVFFLLVSFSVGVIWSHIDAVTTFSPVYRNLAKAGLGVVEFVALVFLIWEVFTKHKVLSMTCFIADFVLVVVMLVHAGAVLQLDSSGSRQEKTVGFMADALAKVEAAKEAARIKAAGEKAAELNRSGQHRTAAMIARSAASGGGRADNSLLERVLGETKPTTFLPESYMNGGLYYWPPLIAFTLFMLVMLVSKGAIEYEDANNNGIPDRLEPWAHRGRRQAGFAPGSTNFTIAAPTGRDHDPKD